MNNIKKIGMTALAASLVSTSVFAGELTVSGAASMSYENYTTTETASAASNNKTFTQGNAITFAGGGELDNGMTVALSFELDDGANNSTASTSVWDNHSVTVSSDALGSFSLSGHGGSSAQSALDTTAAGDMFDNFDGTAGIATTETFNSSKAGDNIMKYTLPAIMDDLAVSVSYQAGGNADAGSGSSTAFGATYTGVEGLSVSYGVGDDNDTSSDEREVTTMSASYAYGSFTLSMSESENDATTADTDQKLKSMAVSYTVTDDLSVTYGEETMENAADAVDAEYSGFKVAYTSGGMTVTAGTQTAENADGTATDKDVDYNYLTLGFAF
jgi:outer membrane protein OmpU